MPVSYAPCFVSLLLVAAPLLFLPRGKKSFLIVCGISLVALLLLLLPSYVPG